MLIPDRITEQLEMLVEQIGLQRDKTRVQHQGLQRDQQPRVQHQGLQRDQQPRVQLIELQLDQRRDLRLGQHQDQLVDLPQDHLAVDLQVVEDQVVEDHLEAVDDEAVDATNYLGYIFKKFYEKNHFYNHSDVRYGYFLRTRYI